MPLNATQAVRLLIQDNTPGLYIVSDDEIDFFLERNSGSVNRAAIEAAKVVLLNLSMRGDQQVDIFSIKGRGAAEQYRLALQLFIRDPNLNPVLQNCQGWVGGISKTEMDLNDANIDNNVVPVARTSVSPSSDPFGY